MLANKPALAEYLCLREGGVSFDQFLACLYLEQRHIDDLGDLTRDDIASAEAVIRAEVAAPKYADSQTILHSEFAPAVFVNLCSSQAITKPPTDPERTLIRYLTVIKCADAHRRSMEALLKANALKDNPSVWNLKVEGRPDLTQLKQHLLKRAGESFQRSDWVAPQISERLCKELLSKGAFLAGNDVTFFKMEKSECHENSKQLAAKTGAEWWLGFALSEDAWRVHSWCVKGDLIFETTAHRDLYFGVPIQHPFEDFLNAMTALAEGRDQTETAEYRSQKPQDVG
jgi:hypothetical protein